MPPPGGFGGGSMHALYNLLLLPEGQAQRGRETVIEGKKVIGLEMEQQGQGQEQRNWDRAKQIVDSGKGTEGQEQKEIVTCRGSGTETEGQGYSEGKTGTGQRNMDRDRNR